jgi:GNAT superfamily N-acetyltransferase
MNFRPFDYSDADYQRWETLTNTIHPDYPQSTEQAKHFVETLGEDEILESFIIEDSDVKGRGKALGWLQYETPRNPVPGALAIHLELLPEYQNHVNQAWDFLQEQIRPLKPSSLITVVTETWWEHDFYKSAGFKVYDSMWASTLDLTTFDPKPFEVYLEKSKQAGIEVKTLPEFPHHEDTFRRTWYALVVELLQNVPSATPFIPWSYETWLARAVNDSGLLPEGSFFALHNNEFVGLSQLWKSSRPRTLQTGLTAVKAPYRRKGIAQTLKVKAALFAKDYGVQFIRTNNHQINRPMLSINETMGFVKEPARLFLKKEFL